MRPQVTRVTTLTGYRNYREVLQILVPDFVALLCYPAKVVKGIVRFLTRIAFYLPSLYKFFILSFVLFVFIFSHTILFGISFVCFTVPLYSFHLSFSL